MIDDRPPAPGLHELPSELRADLLELYRCLGGRQDEPTLRPGAWDLALARGDVIELDEELHFNRYRAETLERSWSGGLPWRDAYLDMCQDHEAACVSFGRWGKRWTTPSCEAMFGPSGPAGDLAAVGGSPRWKQRALYDAVKDAHALAGLGPRLIRLAVHDDLDGIPLGDVLQGCSEGAPEAVRELLRRRRI